MPAQRGITIATWVLLAIGGMIMLSVVAWRGLNVPFTDEWFPTNGAAFAMKLLDGKLTLADLFTPNYEHRIVPTRLVTIINTWLFRYNLRFEMLCTVGLSCANFLWLISIWRKPIKPSRSFGWAVGLVVMAMLAFSVRQYENWVWGFMNCWYWTLFFILSGIWLIQGSGSGKNRIVWIIVLAFAASSSLASGILSWGVFAVMLWFHRERSLRHWLLYAVCALIAAVFVLSAIPSAPEQTISDGLRAAPMSVPENLLRVLESVLIYLGSPFSGSDLRSVPFAFLMGGFGLAAWIGLCRLLLKSGFTWQSLSPWIALALFGIGSALLTALGRALKVTDPSTLLTIRYTPHALSFWFAVAGLAAWLGFSRSGLRKISHKTISSVMLAILFILQFRISWAGPDNLRRIIQDPDLCLYIYVLSGDTACFNQPFFARMPELTQARTDQMLRYQIGTFAEVPRLPITLDGPAFSTGTVNIPIHLPFHYEWQTTAVLPDGCASEATVMLTVQVEARPDETLTRLVLTPDRRTIDLQASLDAYKGNTVKLVSQVEASDPNCKNVEISRGVLRIW